MPLVRVDGTILHVRGLDAYDDTPVVDIKPAMREFLPDHTEIVQAEWVTALMKKYF